MTEEILSKSPDTQHGCPFYATLVFWVGPLAQCKKSGDLLLVYFFIGCL